MAAIASVVQVAGSPAAVTEADRLSWSWVGLAVHLYTFLLAVTAEEHLDSVIRRKQQSQHHCWCPMVLRASQQLNMLAVQVLCHPTMQEAVHVAARTVMDIKTVSCIWGA